MNKYFDSHFNKNIVTIHPGEFYATFDDVFIATVLGSCISIVLIDPSVGLGGMNHFMLPYFSNTRNESEANPAELGRFGDFAIELLINDMLKKGATRKRLQAKVFGGGNVLAGGQCDTNKTGENNISFALQYLETERIPIIGNDIGGLLPRKIYFNPVTAKVYLKRIQLRGQALDTIASREKAYQKTLSKKESAVGDITWF